MRANSYAIVNHVIYAHDVAMFLDMHSCMQRHSLPQRYEVLATASPMVVQFTVFNTKRRPTIKLLEGGQSEGGRALLKQGINSDWPKCDAEFDNPWFFHYL